MRELHYILTVQIPNSTGFGMRTTHGTFTAGPGDTRQEAYLEIVKDLGPEWTGATTVFFSLEPNEIGSGA